MIFKQDWLVSKKPKVLIFSGIHWNETSWIKANKKLALKILSGEIKIKKWSLILVVEANQKAILEWKREINKNMNRIFLDSIKPNCYESSRAKELMWLIKESDYLLDLHSTSWESEPFAFSEENSLSLAKKTGINNIISGWTKLSEQKGKQNIDGTTESYMNNNWWQAITFEAWNHDNPNWENISYKIVLNFLSVLWLIDKKHYTEINWKKTQTEIIWYYVAKSNSFKYSIKPRNFLKINKWQEIGKDLWIPVIAKEDMILIMPKKESIIKKEVEVFFIWKI